ncbi:hypothetical protein NPIL_11981 [Nephila pilipes]|uniref:Uncharacterized protein n=1 Tax=Nephila pilipes TaxID=299642 RepID=A0A8X6QXN9_NEPPI|nr:hypothetical protein NPIL_11981 [Nephila pilipes]
MKRNALTLTDVDFPHPGVDLGWSVGIGRLLLSLLGGLWRRGILRPLCLLGAGLLAGRLLSRGHPLRVRGRGVLLPWGLRGGSRLGAARGGRMRPAGAQILGGGSTGFCILATRHGGDRGGRRARALAWVGVVQTILRTAVEVVIPVLQMGYVVLWVRPVLLNGGARPAVASTPVRLYLWGIIVLTGGVLTALTIAGGQRIHKLI